MDERHEMTQDQLIEEGALKAWRAINDFLDGKLMDENKAKFALQVSSQVQRYRATQNSRASLAYRMCKDLAKNTEELKKYVSVTLPHINPVRLIGNGKKEG